MKLKAVAMCVPVPLPVCKMADKKFVNVEDECFFINYDSDSDCESELDQLDCTNEILEEIGETTGTPEELCRTVLGLTSSTSKTSRSSSASTSSGKTSEQLPSCHMDAKDDTATGKQ